MNPLFADVSIWQSIDLAALALALLGGAIRVGTPFLFVSLGECITESAPEARQSRSRRHARPGSDDGVHRQLQSRQSRSHLPVNLAWAGRSVTLITIAPWLGVLAAGLVGALLGIMHAVICNLPRVNFVAVGIAMMVFGVGLANYLGKRDDSAGRATKLPAFDFGLVGGKRGRPALPCVSTPCSSSAWC